MYCQFRLDIVFIIFLEYSLSNEGSNVEITEVKVKLLDAPMDKERLLAFCSITIDNSFVIRDLKIIQGVNGLFVAMPSRKIMVRCPYCGFKNHIRAKYCNECGKGIQSDKDKSTKIHADIAHPIHSECRDLIQNKVLEAYHAEKANPTPQTQTDDTDI
jgi:stage V sporulation protein G